MKGLMFMIETGRLILRKWTEADADSLLRGATLKRCIMDVLVAAAKKRGTLEQIEVEG